MLDGQNAVVTGAGRGIGLAITEELARQGCNVALIARTGDEVRRAAEQIRSRGSALAAAYEADVRDRAEVARAVVAAEETLGPITLLVNNAGTAGPAGYEWEVDPDDWWECVESIVRGAFNATRAVLPSMIDRGGGRIVDIASVTGTTAWPWATATSLAKTAIIRRIEGLAAAGADQGVRAFALHPGMVKTKLLLSYASHPAMAAFLEQSPPEAFSPPTLAARVVARIAAGELDGLSGRFVDATADLDALIAEADQFSVDTLTLRISAP